MREEEKGLSLGVVKVVWIVSGGGGINRQRKTEKRKGK